MWSSSKITLIDAFYRFISCKYIQTGPDAIP